VFRGKSSQVALEDVFDIYTQEILPPRPHCLGEGLHYARVSISAGRPMYSRLTRAKIGHSELIHITDDLAMSEMQASLWLTGQCGVGDHRKRGGCA
jgi:hypothetical protein